MMVPQASPRNLFSLTILNLIYSMAAGQDVKINNVNPVTIEPLDASTLKVDWMHLLMTGDVDLIEEVELMQKVGQKWKSIKKVTPRETLKIENVSICEEHEKFSVFITPKFGKECHPYCSSTFSDYKPFMYFDSETEPYSCIKNKTSIFIQLDANMTRKDKDMFTTCIKNVGIYEDGELSKFKGKVALTESKIIELTFDKAVKFFELAYEMVVEKNTRMKISAKRISLKEKEQCVSKVEEAPSKWLTVFLPVILTILALGGMGSLLYVAYVKKIKDDPEKVLPTLVQRNKKSEGHFNESAEIEFDNTENMKTKENNDDDPEKRKDNEDDDPEKDMSPLVRKNKKSKGHFNGSAEIEYENI